MTVGSFVIPLQHLGASPNVHVNRWQKAALARDVRQIAALYARRAALPAATGPRSIQLDVQWTSRKRRLTDADNLTAQLIPLVNGLVDAGVIVDDGPRWLTSNAPTQRRGASPWIIVTVVVADVIITVP